MQSYCSKIGLKATEIYTAKVRTCETCCTLAELIATVVIHVTAAVVLTGHVTFKHDCDWLTAVAA